MTTALPRLPQSSGLRPFLGATRALALTATVLLIAATNVAAQSLVWAKAANASELGVGNAFNVGTGVATDSTGNVYVTGHFDRSITFGAGEPNETTFVDIDGSRGRDLFLAKYDTEGRLSWARRVGGWGGDFAMDVVVDAVGNSYVAGHLASLGADFGNGVELAVGGAFVAKYDTEGNALWATALDQAGLAFGLDVDDSGNTSVAGCVQIASGGCGAITTWKLQATGASLWVRQPAGVHSGIVGGVSVDHAGNTYVAGYLDGTATFDNATTLSTSNHIWEMFVAKYDLAGNVIWAKQSADDGGNTFGYGISTDGMGNVYLAGSGGALLGSGPNETQLPGPGWIAKYDSAGNLSWARSIVGGTVGAQAIDADAGGDLYTSGWFGNAVGFAPGEPNETLIFGVHINNIFIAKYGGDGAFHWARPAGTHAVGLLEPGPALTLDTSGNPHLVGAYGLFGLFGPGEPNETTLASAGGWGVFVAKYLDRPVPDLAISSLSAPGKSGVGRSITIRPTTANIGIAPAGASETGLYLSPDNVFGDGDDIPLAAPIAVPGLAPSASSVGRRTVPIPDVQPGRYYIFAIADVGNGQAETDETNNTRAKAILIGPDLVVSVITAPTSTIPGATISVTVTTKNNGGGAAALGSTTRVYFSNNAAVDGFDTTFADIAVGALAPGAVNTTTVMLTVPSTTPLGKRYLIGLADADNNVPETNNGNNKRTRIITIQ